MNLILNKKEEIRKVKDELLKLQVDVTENKRLIEGKTNQTFELIEQESKKITGNKAKSS